MIKMYYTINFACILQRLIICLILTLYDLGGGFLKAPPPIFVLTYLILELHYCTLGLFPKNSLAQCGENKMSLGAKI